MTESSGTGKKAESGQEKFMDPDQNRVYPDPDSVNNRPDPKPCSY